MKRPFAIGVDNYKKMIDFIRSLFESALKSNDSLAFSVITGCLRISRESIFTGLNNLDIISILNEDYAEYFGFTDAEIDEMLGYYEIESRKEEIQQWYNGYLFGNTKVYNPWSVLNYAKSVSDGKENYPRPYWSNTSSNSIVREMIELADEQTKGEIESLIEGNCIEKPVHEDITYQDIHSTSDNLWNFLFFTGYLKKAKERFLDDQIFLSLKIPNLEVKYIYRNSIQEWFQKRLGAMELSKLYQAVQSGDCKVFEEQVTQQLTETISVFDYAENYYHGFLTGLLKGCSGYRVLSNRESGTGRPDLIFKTLSVRGQAIIMELKVAKTFQEMHQGCETALCQIESRDYEKELRQEGYTNIIKYGICFYRKECLVEKG